MDLTTQVWSHEQRALWERVAAHPFQNDGIALDFTRRLARTLGWPLDETRALVEQYRRFCFLAVVSDIGAVTPSEEVDEVWHLHLAYTRDYWDRWCGEALGRRLHHDPTVGGPAEQARYRQQYAATLALYERWFGPPPAAFWPGTAQRFAAQPRFRMVDRRRKRLSPLRHLRLTAFGTLLTLAATPARGASPDWDLAGLNPFDLDGPSFLMLYALLLVLVAMSTWLLRDLARTTERRPDLRDLGDVELGYCVGGNQRAADTLYVALASRGAASLGRDGIVVEGPMPGLPPQLEAFRQALVGASSRLRFKSAFTKSSPYEAMLNRLVARKILLDPSRRLRLSMANWLPVGLLLAFGLLKVCVGISRGRPVGFLQFFLAATFLAFAATLRRERYVTRETSASLEHLRHSRSRALRAPMPDEVPFAFAMLGTVALDGTAHAGYANLVNQTDSGGGSGCGTGGSSDGGGGCGGCSS